MTTISAVITEDGIFCTGDTLVTSLTNGIVKDRFSSSKKVIEATCVLDSKFPELKGIYDGEDTRSFNIGFGFSGNVSLIESLKSRINHKVSYGSYGKISKNKKLPLNDICSFYIFIFNQILENHLFTYYDYRLRVGLNSDDYNSINTSCILFGYCEVDKQHKIYEIFIDRDFIFKQKEITQLYNVVTIGDKVTQINKILNKNITYDKCSSLGYGDFTRLFNSLIFKFVIDKEYKTIGGTITSYHLYENIIHEFILQDPFYKKIEMSGLSVYGNSSKLEMSSYYVLELDVSLIGESNINDYYKKKDAEVFEIIKFIKYNKLKIKLNDNRYSAYSYNIGTRNYEEFENFPYDDLYYCRVIKDIVNRTNFLIRFSGSDFLELNWQCVTLQNILMDM